MSGPLPKQKRKEEEIVYLRGKPTDHKAQKVTLMLDLVERGQAGKGGVQKNINYFHGIFQIFLLIFFMFQTI